MATRDRARTLTKPLETQHLAANWTDKFFAGVITRTAK